MRGLRGAGSAAGDARRWQQQRPRKTVRLILGCMQERMQYALACTYAYVCIRDVCVKCGWRVCLYGWLLPPAYWPAVRVET